MPSTQLFPQSGGIGLVSGNIFAGTLPPSKVLLKLSTSASGSIYVGLPNLSGDVITALSGGSLSSGGMADGIELAPGGSYTVERSRMVSGIQSIRLIVPSAVSGGRLFWDWY